MKHLPTLVKKTAALGVATALLFGATACGGDDESKGKESQSKPDSSKESEEEKAAKSAGEPDWANPVTKPGEKLTTVEAGDVTVDVYQVDVAKASKAGNTVDKETNKPIIDKGDDIVYVNYVITNTGDAIDLGPTLVDVSPKYADWKYLGGMTSITDSAQAEEMDIHTNGLEPGKNTDPPIYALGEGETFSYGTNFKYQKGSPITFTVSYTPVDDKGERISAEKQETEGKTEIK